MRLSRKDLMSETDFPTQCVGCSSEPCVASPGRARDQLEPHSAPTIGQGRLRTAVWVHGDDVFENELTVRGIGHRAISRTRSSRCHRRAVSVTGRSGLSKSASDADGAQCYRECKIADEHMSPDSLFSLEHQSAVVSSQASGHHVPARSDVAIRHLINTLEVLGVDMQAFVSFSAAAPWAQRASYTINNWTH